MYRLLLSTILIAGSLSAFGEKFPQAEIGVDYQDTSSYATDVSKYSPYFEYILG